MKRMGIALGCAVLLCLSGWTKEKVLFLSAHPDDIISSLGTCLLMRDKFEVHVVDITSVAAEKERLIRLYKCQNADDAMCREEMRNSRMRAGRLWPPRLDGYAEAFAPYVGRSQGPCIFTEIPRDPVGAKMPEWGW